MLIQSIFRFKTRLTEKRDLNKMKKLLWSAVGILVLCEANIALGHDVKLTVTNNSPYSICVGTGASCSSTVNPGSNVVVTANSNEQHSSSTCAQSGFTAAVPATYAGPFNFGIPVPQHMIVMSGSSEAIGGYAILQSNQEFLASNGINSAFVFGTPPGSSSNPSILAGTMHISALEKTGCVSVCNSGASTGEHLCEGYAYGVAITATTAPGSQTQR